MFDGFKKGFKRCESFVDENLAKKTREQLLRFHKRNMLPKKKQGRLLTPDHIKIFKPHDEIDIQKILEIWRSGAYDLRDEDKNIKLLEHYLQYNNGKKISKMLNSGISGLSKNMKQSPSTTSLPQSTDSRQSPKSQEVSDAPSQLQKNRVTFIRELSSHQTVNSYRKSQQDALSLRVSSVLERRRQVSTPDDYACSQTADGRFRKNQAIFLKPQPKPFAYSSSIKIAPIVRDQKYRAIFDTTAKDCLSRSQKELARINEQTASLAADCRDKMKREKLVQDLIDSAGDERYDHSKSMQENLRSF
jgi:hypothetical protein